MKVSGRRLLIVAGTLPMGHVGFLLRPSRMRSIPLEMTT